MPEMKNTRVRYKSQPDKVGWLVDVENDKARVFIEGSVKIIPVDQLEPIPAIALLDPQSFRISLTKRRLEHPLTDQLLSYRSSRTKLYYHQFLPIKKILESPDQRLLIADEVGTGKTVEAGLIWAELEARAPYGLQNVWVVCPKALTTKWQEEMLLRFDLRLELLTSEGLRQALVSLDRDGVLPPRFSQAVVNIELLRGDEYVSRLGKTSIAWDYVVFDEAHHLRNPDTLSYSLARFVCERAKTAVFLTATPLQTGLDDIVHLMQALGVDVAADPALLEEQIRWDMQLNDFLKMIRHRPPDFQDSLIRMLDKLELSRGNEREGWTRFRALVMSSNLYEAPHRAAIFEAARDLQILGPYMTRTLRSEIDVQRPIREAITRAINFNSEEQNFYHEIYQICLERARSIGVTPVFATQMPERRVASCAPAVAAEILGSERERESEEHATRFDRDEIERLAPLARLVLGTSDSKFSSLVEMLRRLFGELHVDRAMIFSTFRGTLHYLANQLRTVGFSIEVLHGGIPPREEDCRKGEKSRELISRQFRRGEFQLLLASEVVGEGLDFEHCHAVINYDLPWNPMRVEQRIGRCDRIGQKSPKVYVGSLASVGTIEERILTRLYERLQIFERALGELELILGEQIASFEHDVFTEGLSPHQQEERLDRIAQAVANVNQERELISKSSDNFLAGRRLLETDQQEIENAKAKFLTLTEIGEYVLSVFEKKIPHTIKSLGKGDTYEILVNESLRQNLGALLRAYPQSHSSRAEIIRFLKRLEEGNVKLSFTSENDGVEFVHVRHPVVLLSRWLDRETLPDVPTCQGSIEGRFSSPILLVWCLGSLEGYTSRMELLCAALDCKSGSISRIAPEEAFDLILEMKSLPDSLATTPNDLIGLSTKAEEFLETDFRQVVNYVKSRNEMLSSKAKNAIQSQAKRKLEWLQKQLFRTDLNDNIRNLYRGWASRLESETQAKLKEIDAKNDFRTSLQIIGAAMLVPIERASRSIEDEMKHIAKRFEIPLQTVLEWRDDIKSDLRSEAKGDPELEDLVCLIILEGIVRSSSTIAEKTAAELKSAYS